MQNDTREQIKVYLDKIFTQAPCTQKAISLKEGILADILEKYDDLIADGFDPQDAYQRAIGSIGDLDKLISDLRHENPDFTPRQNTAYSTDSPNHRRAVFNSINSALWMLVLVAYFLVSFATDAWHITWVIFLIGGALSNIVRAIFDLTGGKK